MCTLVVLHRPGDPWPLLLAANRDEMVDRGWDAPAAHWPEHPRVVGGRDHLAGGTWLAINRAGVVAAVLNRQGSLGPKLGKRSRGELPLIALAEDSAEAAAAAITRLDAGEWRRFNMVIADRSGAYFLRGLATGTPHAERLAPGLAMVTARDPNDLTSPRVARHLPRLMAAPAPVPPDDWESWRSILADRSGAIESQFTITPRGGFGTVCASLLALPANGIPVWLFAPGPPDSAAFTPVALAAD